MSKGLLIFITFFGHVPYNKNKVVSKFYTIFIANL
jgi:hypothetical protein